MLNEEDTYYITLMCFELVRVYTLMDNLEEAKVHLEKGKSILKSKFGDETTAIYLDANLC